MFIGSEHKFSEDEFIRKGATIEGEEINLIDFY
jgi:hypothetical protein